MTICKFSDSSHETCISFQVMIANDRRSGSGKDPKEDEKMLRLFLVVPKDYTDEELREKFEVSKKEYT